MRDKILKLAKRMNKFTFEDIEPILNIDNLQEILDELVEENLLKFQNRTYFYIKKKSKNLTCHYFFSSIQKKRLS